MYQEVGGGAEGQDMQLDLTSSNCLCLCRRKYLCTTPNYIWVNNSHNYVKQMTQQFELYQINHAVVWLQRIVENNWSISCLNNSGNEEKMLFKEVHSTHSQL